MDSDTVGQLQSESPESPLAEELPRPSASDVAHLEEQITSMSDRLASSQGLSANEVNLLNHESAELLRYAATFPPATIRDILRAARPQPRRRIPNEWVSSSDDEEQQPQQQQSEQQPQQQQPQQQQPQQQQQSEQQPQQQQPQQQQPQQQQPQQQQPQQQSQQHPQEQQPHQQQESLQQPRQSGGLILPRVYAQNPSVQIERVWSRSADGRSNPVGRSYDLFSPVSSDVDDDTDIEDDEVETPSPDQEAPSPPRRPAILRGRKRRLTHDDQQDVFSFGASSSSARRPVVPNTPADTPSTSSTPAPVLTDITNIQTPTSSSMGERVIPEWVRQRRQQRQQQELERRQQLERQRRAEEQQRRLREQQWRLQEQQWREQAHQRRQERRQQEQQQNQPGVLGLCNHCCSTFRLTQGYLDEARDEQTLQDIRNQIDEMISVIASFILKLENSITFALAQVQTLNIKREIHIYFFLY